MLSRLSMTIQSQVRLGHLLGCSQSDDKLLTVALRLYRNDPMMGFTVSDPVELTAANHA